jgi:hypothetical protein
MSYYQHERTWPLRRVVKAEVAHWSPGGRCTFVDTLECGHKKRVGYSEAEVGKTRRRCQECSESGQPQGEKR